VTPYPLLIPRSSFLAYAIPADPSVRLACAPPSVDTAAAGQAALQLSRELARVERTAGTFVAFNIRRAHNAVSHRREINKCRQYKSAKSSVCLRMCNDLRSYNYGLIVALKRYVAVAQCLSGTFTRR
jgi:hypothetical protein